MAEHFNTPARRRARDPKEHVDDGPRIDRLSPDGQQQEQTPRQEASREALKQAERQANRD